MANTSTSELIMGLNNAKKECIEAIAEKGVEINANIGFKDLPEKIKEISTEAVTGVIVDNSLAFKKTVPTNSTKYCYLNSIGGMTYKIPDTFIATVTEVDDYGYIIKAEFEYIPSIPFKIPTPDNGEYGGWVFECPVDGYDNFALNSGGCQLTINGTIECDGMNIPTDVLITSIRGTLTDSSMNVFDFTVGQELVCTPRFFDISGTANAGYFDPPVPLRDTKTTTIKSYSANSTLVKQYSLPQSLIDVQTGRGIENYFDEIDLENNKATHRTKTIKLADVEGWSSVQYGSTNLDGNAFISNNGLAGFRSYSVNDFLLSKTNACICNVLPTTTDWQGRTYGVNLQKMNDGVHYIIVAVPIKALGITSSATQREISEAITTWLNENDATLIYALESPVEGEIATGFEPLIEVEGGGMLEFVNEYGKDVPSTVTFSTTVI